MIIRWKGVHWKGVHWKGVHCRGGPMCPPENIHVGNRVIGHVAAFGRAHRPSPTVFSFYFGQK